MIELEIEINGGARQRCEDVGLIPRTLSLANLAADELVLTQVRKLGAAPALAYEDTIAFYVDGVRRFRGTVLDPAHSYDAGDVSTTFTAQNWWRNFVRLQYTYSVWGYRQINDVVYAGLYGQDIKMGWAFNLSTTPITIPLAANTCGKTIAYPQRATAPYQDSLKVELEKYFAYVLARHPGLFSTVSVPFGSAILPMPRPIQNQSVADLLIQAMTLMPAGVFRSDYSTTTTTISAVDSDAASVRTFAINAPPVRSIRFAANKDMRPKGVLLRFGVPNYYVGIPDGWVDLHAVSLWNAWPVQTRQDEPNVIAMDLSPDEMGVYMGVNVNQAQWVYDQMSVLRGRGGVELDDPDLTLGIRPGDRLAFSGDHASVEHGAMTVQHVTHDFGRGRTRCQMGYPRALNLDQIKDRQGWFHRGIWGYSQDRPGMPVFA